MKSHCGALQIVLLVLKIRLARQGCDKWGQNVASVDNLTINHEKRHTFGKIEKGRGGGERLQSKEKRG